MRKKIFSPERKARPGQSLVRGGLAAGSGLLLTAAFPDTGAFWLAYLALVPLFVAIEGLRFSEGFRLGFLAGLVHFLTLLYWLVPTMALYGPLPWYLSVPLLVLLSAYLSLFPAVFSGIAARMPLRAAPLLVGIPGLWVFFEFLRSTLFTGFPWELLGYSQARWLHLIQISDIIGVFGVSFLILFCNMALFHLIPPSGRHPGPKPGSAGKALLAAAVLMGLAWGYGELRIRQVEKNAARSEKIQIAVVQGNIEQGLKWDPGYQAASVEKYIGLTKTARLKRPDLVVWPETATPFYLFQDAQLTKAVLEGIRDEKSAFLIGSPAYETATAGIDYFNSAYLTDSAGKIFGRYDKAHLVPYGEYVPLKRWMPFLGKMVAHVGDFEAGETGRVIKWNGKRVGTLICYEVIFPYLSRALVENGAQVLINLTNDAWYGDTSAPRQHFFMAVFRAVENRRFLVRSANTGISGFIDAAGRVGAQTPLFTEAVLTREVPLMREETLYCRYGDWFPIACAFIAAATGGFIQRRKP